MAGVRQAKGVEDEWVTVEVAPCEKPVRRLRKGSGVWVGIMDDFSWIEKKDGVECAVLDCHSHD